MPLRTLGWRSSVLSKDGRAWRTSFGPQRRTRAMSLSTEPEGSVYDLGYRAYEGVRLGRTHSILSLYVTSLPGVFGLGRHTSSKILPFGLAILALVPAVVQLAFVAVAETVDFEITSAATNYEVPQWPL